MSYYPILVQKHEQLNVVRGDLYPGGLKCRVLQELFESQISESEIVYAGCYYGHSCYALGIAGLLTGKKVTLFMPQPWQDTYIHQLVMSLNNVTCHLVAVDHQDQVFEVAKTYAENCGARIMPVGLKSTEFAELYVEVMRSIQVSPEVIWVTGGSGLSARSLQQAWPDAKVNVVDLNVRKNQNFGAPYKVWNIPEKLTEESRASPPWPAARFYDAKIWQVVKEHATPGALVWNIA